MNKPTPKQIAARNIKRGFEGVFYYVDSEKVTEKQYEEINRHVEKIITSFEKRLDALLKGREFEIDELDIFVGGGTNERY